MKGTVECINAVDHFLEILRNKTGIFMRVCGAVPHRCHNFNTDVARGRRGNSIAREVLS